MPVRDAVEERDDDVQARLEHLLELAQPLDHPGALLRHDAYALNNEHGRQRDDGERNPQRMERLVPVDEDRGDDDRDDFEKHAASEGA